MYGVERSSLSAGPTGREVGSCRAPYVPTKSGSLPRVFYNFAVMKPPDVSGNVDDRRVVG